MINFNKNTAWNLTPINLNSIHNEVAGLMVNGERPLMAFKTIRDQLVFRNKRIISIDVQGITGKRRSFTSLPYSKVQFFRSRHPASWSWFPTQNCSSILRMDLKLPSNSEEMWI